ncbi:hypothetical protein Cni_G12295 [Canna indica]|uniref:Amino acid transporter transmembrane domain-containing protein n=1 Tax=Canna indica TaxID=4628 RepID=A0AAQ3K9H9_9LILI|nr:hypothetical protein Cni_G12295 [Canna indica]
MASCVFSAGNAFTASLSCAPAISASSSSSSCSSSMGRTLMSAAASANRLVILSCERRDFCGPLAARLLGPPTKFEASKLKVVFMGEEMEKQAPCTIQRAYTLTHCDFTANLTLAVSNTMHGNKLMGWQTTLNSDDVVAEWKKINEEISLHVHCYVSGSSLLQDLAAGFRYHIFSKELPLVLKAVVYGDSVLFGKHPELLEAKVWVYFHSKSKKYNRLECWGPLKDAMQIGAANYYHHAALELGHPQAASKCYDDDGRLKRTGTVLTASSHIITAVIGSGVLSLAWAVGQLGWVAGPAVMLLFSFVTYYTSSLLADCYRSGDPNTGKRNYTYMDAVRAYLDGFKVKLCGYLQYLNIVGVAIGYTIAASISMVAVKRSNCFHENGDDSPCVVNSNPYMIMFGVAQIVFSQIPDFDQIWWLSIVAAVMSFTYSSIGLALGIVQVIKNGGIRGSLTGISIGTVSQMDKVWRSLQAFGDIAFAYSYSIILIEIQDTIKAPPPSEAKVMKKATLVSVWITTIFYMLCGCMGYAAFGDLAPGNLLTGFGFYNPFWLLDIANVAIVVHLVGAYQVYCQPLFAFVEKWAAKRWPESGFIGKEIEVPLPGSRVYKLNLFRLTWRSAFVVVTTVVSMLLPFFNDVVGLLGAVGFWPLTVYFPVEMYIVHKKIEKWSTRWLCLQLLSIACLAITIASAAGSIAGVVSDLKVYKPFSG